MTRHESVSERRDGTLCFGLRASAAVYRTAENVRVHSPCR